MNIPLERDKPVPLARQIQAHFERLIAEGLLAPGVKLPATRELAQTLGVNRTTVALAYEELVAGGLARAHVGQGTFVAEPRAARAGGAAVARRPARSTGRALLSRARASSRPTRTAGARLAPADAQPAPRPSPSRAACRTAGCSRPTPSAACSTR